MMDCIHVAVLQLASITWSSTPCRSKDMCASDSKVESSTGVQLLFRRKANYKLKCKRTMADSSAGYVYIITYTNWNATLFFKLFQISECLGLAITKIFQFTSSLQLILELSSTCTFIFKMVIPVSIILVLARVVTNHGTKQRADQNTFISFAGLMTNDTTNCGSTYGTSNGVIPLIWSPSSCWGGWTWTGHRQQRDWK